MSKKQAHNNTTEKNIQTSADPFADAKSEFHHHNEDYTYRCPYCEVSYQNEVLVRVHITRSEDKDHLNYNGFMPETKVDIERNGEVIDTISRRPEEVDPSSLSLDVIPEDKQQNHRHILLIAAMNPEESNYTKITEIVKKRLDEHDLEPLSYSTIRRVIRRFYRPQEHSGGSSTEVETLSDLTPKQQAILIAKLILPEATPDTIAEHINCAKSYPTQVYERADDIIAELESKVGQENDPRSVIRNELTDEDIYELVEQGLLETLPVDFKRRVGEDREDDASQWGSPLSQQGGMSASYNSLNRSSDGADSNHSEQSGVTNSIDSESDNSSEELVSDNSKEASPRQEIPRREIEKLKEKVRFLREVFDYHPDDSNELLVSLSEQIERRCEEILQGESKSDS